MGFASDTVLRNKADECFLTVCVCRVFATGHLSKTLTVFGLQMLLRGRRGSRLCVRQQFGFTFFNVFAKDSK